VRLALDEMLARAIAEQLRSRDNDVIAVSERPALRGLADPVLLEEMAAERRALLTENAAHFVPAFEQMLAEGKTCHGLAVTSPARACRAATRLSACTSARSGDFSTSVGPKTGSSIR